MERQQSIALHALHLLSLHHMYAAVLHVGVVPLVANSVGSILFTVWHLASNGNHQLASAWHGKCCLAA
jgi:hypothetical protein